MRTILIILAYVTAFFSIYAAMQIAPDMKWPHTDREWIAANLLVIGMASKLFGHSLLLLCR